MEIARITHESRVEKFQGRAKSARKWARMARIGILALGLTAIWQERALSPVVHDKMQVVYAYGLDLLERSEGGSGYLTAMSNFKGNGNQSQHDPITATLLKLRQ